MNNITYKQKISLGQRKKDINGKLIYNAINKDLKPKEGDILLCVCKTYSGGHTSNITITNLNNGLQKTTSASMFNYTLAMAFEYTELI